MQRLVAVLVACAACHPNPAAPEPASSLTAAASATATPPATSQTAAPAAASATVAPAAASEEFPTGPNTQYGTFPNLNEGCMAKCDKKHATRDLVEAVTRRQAAASSCYQKALRTDPRLSGRVAMTVRLGPDGKACYVQITRNELGDSGVAECAEDVFFDFVYPPPDGGCVEVNVPLRFLPRSALDGGVQP
jgi:hypothetical protein